MNASEQIHRILVIAAALIALPRPAIAASQCVEYGTASLAGTLVRQTHPGPPDYESVTKGDEPQTIWVLQLDRRTCVHAEQTYAGGHAEREVQLVLDAKQHVQYRKFLGEQLIVTGELHRGGARHEKRLVLIVQEMKKVLALRGNSHAYESNCRCWGAY